MLGQLRRLKLKTPIDLPFAHGFREPDYTRRLDMVWQQISAGYQSVIGVDYCCID